MAKYEAKAESSKTKKWLQRVSETICHYSQVLDVFVQHHPEYVALVLGTMKLVFISAVNHAETLELLSTSLFEVAQRFPRARVLSMLYPTKEIRVAVERLYAAMLQFLLMAHSWFNESKFRHIYHSFTRPHELRYKKLLQRMTGCTNEINEWADVGVRTEIRVMHAGFIGQLEKAITAVQNSTSDKPHRIDGLIRAASSLRDEVRQQHKLLMHNVEASRNGTGAGTDQLIARVEALHSITTSGQLNNNQKLSELQLSQVLNSLSQQFEDPDRCLKQNLFFRHRRASGRGNPVSTNEFWLSPKLAKWSSGNGSSLAIIKGTFTLRSAIQVFGVNANLSMWTVPTLWALASSQKPRSSPTLTTTDLVKYLTYQALRFPRVVQTEKQMSWHYSQLQTERTLREWLTLFKRIIGGLGRQVYMVVDLAMVGSLLESVEGLNFIQEISQVLSDVSEQEKGVKVKMVILAYEAEWFRLISRELSDPIIPVKPMRTGRRQGEEMRNSINRQFVSSRGTRQARRV
ncbi:hypothetical protein NCS57_00651000 [Fusarium keratoplasticum]|uniref:Uncharacterized protein n=1 Tax=Fusarium keratoplasticum TaxID=1328300 RepID=A0ACC0R1Y3_9HYPO|nr:hypothetical protein NCS57_00651000 [Fusarium keratoplasticum]KAI8671749.1 hypothetical protein NCS57_00651000 [Fusarium keratoplasticum]KAI8678970.1 hypothetical protein NCS55_00619700 [Fusarium keratoplasticum]